MCAFPGHDAFVLTVLALTGVALDHLVASLEAGEGHVSDRVLFVVRLLRGDDGCEGGKGEVNTREGHQVGLELVQVDVERAIETQRSGDGGDDLSDETVQVGEARLVNAETLLANVVNRLVIDLQVAHALAT